MTLLGGYYVVGMRYKRVLAIIAGPFKSRARANAICEAASKSAASRFQSMRTEDTFGVAFLALPWAIPGSENGQLWITPEYREHEPDET